MSLSSSIHAQLGNRANAMRGLRSSHKVNSGCSAASADEKLALAKLSETVSELRHQVRLAIDKATYILESIHALGCLPDSPLSRIERMLNEN
jgi:hypothetical protein